MVVEIFKDSDETYGYRRVLRHPSRRTGPVRPPPVVRVLRLLRRPRTLDVPPVCGRRGPCSYR